MMKALRSTANIEAKFLIELSEDEARALNEFTMYAAYKATMDFIDKGWHNKIKKDKLLEFFNTVHSELSPHIIRVDEARRIFDSKAPSKP